MSPAAGFTPEGEPQSPAPAPTDRALTILTCAPGLLATKRIVATPGGSDIVGYDKAKYFYAKTVGYRWRSRLSRGGRLYCGGSTPPEARHAQAQPD